MFEAALLFGLLGIILWYILSKGDSEPTRKTPIVGLASELKPARKQEDKHWR